MKIRFEKSFRHHASIVFAAIIDAHNKSAWDKEVIAESLEPAGAVQIGSKLHQTRRFMGQTIRSTVVVQAIEPDKLFMTAELPGQQTLRNRYELEPNTAGCTLVKHFELGLPALIAPLVALGVRRSLKKRFDNLEHLLDQHKDVALVAA